MTVNELIEMLKKHHNGDDEVIFYNLENYELKQYKLETILNADGQCEITTYDPTKEKENIWKRYTEQSKDLTNIRENTLLSLVIIKAYNLGKVLKEMVGYSMLLKRKVLLAYKSNNQS